MSWLPAIRRGTRPAASGMALAATTLAAGLASATPPLRDQPRAGAFLYATPDLTGSLFGNTVVLLVQHDGSGSLGLIVNKPTDMALAEVLDIDGVEELQTPLYFGGPVGIDGLTGLFRAERPPDEGKRVIGDVFFTTARGALETALTAADADSRVRIYAGYSGWGPGQLQGEIDRGSWVVTPAKPDHVFLDDPSELWEDIYLLLNRIEASLQEAVGHSLASEARSGADVPGGQGRVAK